VERPHQTDDEEFYPLEGLKMITLKRKNVRITIRMDYQI
jgi:hypothetical protein